MPYKDKEIGKQKKKEYYLKNREIMTQEEREVYRKYYREYYQRTKDARKICIHKSYLKHAKKKLEYTKKWRRENRDKCRVYAKKLYYNNASHKLAERMRNRIRLVLNGIYKTTNTWNLVGCTTDELKQHLQRTATMNGYLNFDINSYNGKHYHIDHVIPCAAFNLRCSYHQKMCFHYTNLQILDAKTNMIKSDSICLNEIL